MPTFSGQKNYEHEIPAKIGVLVVNLGTPDAPTPAAVRRYLAEFLADQRIVELPKPLWYLILYGLILPFRSGRSAKLYQEIWLGEQGSPLLHHSMQLAKGIQQQFDQQGMQHIAVECAMRYGSPSIPDALNKLRDQNVRHLFVLPLFPQYSAATSASVFDAVGRYFQQQRWLPDVSYLSGYPDNDNYINAVADSIQTHWKTNQRGDILLFSFHGIPKRNFDKGDPYYCYCHKTARLVAERCQLPSDKWKLVFQSRFGKQPWLQPYCDETLRQLPQRGVKSIDIVCPGFAVDCLETLEEINITNQAIFKEAGGQQYHYIPALNATDSHIHCLSNIIRSNIQPWLSEQQSTQESASSCPA